MTDGPVIPSCKDHMNGTHNYKPAGEWYTHADEDGVDLHEGFEYRNTVCVDCGDTATEGRPKSES